MNDWMQGGDGPGRDDLNGDSDYRIRETEARLDRRLANMESGYARMRAFAVLAGAACVLSLVALVVGVRATGARGGSQTVESLAVQTVMLHDEDGVERGRLATDAEGRAILSLSDRDGQERIRLTVLADGSPGVTINDPEARPRAVLGYLPDGTTNLVFTDRTGEIRTLVGVGPDGAPSVSVFDEDSGSSDDDEAETS